MDVATAKARDRGITYPLLYDESTDVTRALGLWSDHMQMPWMGYLIIDRSGRVVASELQLSESKGAAPKNVDEILAALDGAREGGASAGLAFNAVHGFYRRLGPYLGAVSFVSGVLLIAVGILVYTGSLVTINQYFGFGPGGWGQWKTRAAE